MYDTAIIIPHYNDVTRLKRCLEALMPQVGGDVEVVVADNGSTESLDPVCGRWPDLRIVAQPEKGAGPARNAGVATMTAPWLMFLDADCVPAPDWIETGRRIRRPGVITGGEVTLFDETPPPRSGAEAFETVFAFQVERYLRQDGFLVSAHLVLSRADFEAVGGFRSGIAEDIEWCHRATACGHRLVLDPALRVVHPTRSDWAALLRKWRRMVLENFEMYGRTTGGKALYLVKALLMPVSIVAHAPRILGDSRLSVGEKGRALATLIWIRLTRLVWMLRQVVTGHL